MNASTLKQPFRWPNLVNGGRGDARVRDMHHSFNGDHGLNEMAGTKTRRHLFLDPCRPFCEKCALDSRLAQKPNRGGRPLPVQETPCRTRAIDAVTPPTKDFAHLTHTSPFQREVGPGPSDHVTASTEERSSPRTEAICPSVQALNRLVRDRTR